MWREKKYIRLCPECEKELKYTTLNVRNVAERNKKICVSCCNRKRPPVSDVECETRRIRMVEWHTRVGLTDKQKKKISESEKGKFVSDETREKLRKSHLGKKLSDETKEKLRITSKKAWQDGKYDKMIQKTMSKSSQLFLNIIEKKLKIKFDDREFLLEEKYYDALYGNIIIEVDSKYWHRLPEHAENDRLKNKIAKDNNYKLYRFEVNSEKEARNVFLENEEKLKSILY